MTLSRFSLTLNVLAPCCTVLVLVGCAPAVNPNAIDYHSQGSQKRASLWAPPDMTGPASANESGEAAAELSALPSGRQPTTWSAYQRKELATSSLNKMHRAAPTSNRPPVIVESDTQNLHAALKIYLKREAGQYWLVVKGQSVEKLLPQIQKFWVEQDFELKNIDKSQTATLALEGAVVETQWREMPASVNTGFVRSNLSKVFNTGYVTRQKNKYRTRIEPHAKYTASTGRQSDRAASDFPPVRIFISQTAVKEVRTGLTKEVSQWELAEHDAFSEARYLQQLMQALQRKSVALDAGKTSVAATSADIKNNEKTQDIKTATEAIQPLTANASVLNLDQPFDRAWFEIGLALEQLNFTVEDRDRTQGLYYVRYVDPHDQSVVRQGFWSQLFRGRKEKKAHAYAINVRALQEDYTRIAVLTPSGEVDTSLQAKRIVALINDAIHPKAIYTKSKS